MRKYALLAVVLVLVGDLTTGQYFYGSEWGGLTCIKAARPSGKEISTGLVWGGLSAFECGHTLWSRMMLGIAERRHQIVTIQRIF